MEVVENVVDVEDPEKLPPPPPPAYGLWRSSVRVDPNLLHWQRVHDERASVITDTARSRNASLSGPAAFPLAPAAHNTTGPATEGPRPPSYISEDGVSYITDAVPRSTVRQSHTGVSDIHPAWRPNYAMSEIRGDEVPNRF